MVDDIALGHTLTGLADPTRRAIVASLATGPRTFSDLAADHAISPPAVSRHLRILREAGLVSERRVPSDGRVRLYALEDRPLKGLVAWLSEIRRYRAIQLDDV